mmetsp:Transcript_18720/g.26037  ORF Transcript_18720/g.26037 Transcript_18720/m.26037 type:complete len:157 (+) Transcript_18720:164-634(+)
MLQRKRPGGIVHSLFVLISFPLFLGVRPSMPMTSRISTTTSMPKIGMMERNSSLDDPRPSDKPYSAGALFAWTVYFFMNNSSYYFSLSNHKQQEATILDYNMQFSSCVERWANIGSNINQDNSPPRNASCSHNKSPSGTKNSAHLEVELPQQSYFI